MYSFVILDSLIGIAQWIAVKSLRQKGLQFMKELETESLIKSEKKTNNQESK